MTLHLRATVQATNMLARALLAALRLAPMPPSEPPTEPEPRRVAPLVLDADTLADIDATALEAELVRRWDAAVALVATPADLLGGSA